MLILLISTGLGGCGCHPAFSCRNRPEGLVPEFSLSFCATGQEYVQLGGVSLQVQIRLNPPTNVCFLIQWSAESMDLLDLIDCDGDAAVQGG